MTHVKTWLRISVAVVLALFGAVFLLDALSVLFKGNQPGHSDLYFGGETDLFLCVTLLLGTAAIHRATRRVRQK